VEHRLSRGRRRAAPALVALSFLLAGCAGNPDEYPVPRESGGWTDGSVVRTVLLWVVLPLVLSGVIYALAWLPGSVKSNRYRPQLGWGAPPVWFAGPSDPVAAVEQAQPADVVRGGAGGDW
jgi:hypothetical protein